MFGLLVISLLERTFPYRKEWRPNHKDILNDATFMVLVQNLLPMFLGYIVSITLLENYQETVIAIKQIWPAQLPLLAQLLLMMVCAEFVRYWLHRLSHNWAPLWRFHAVHHSPHKLYWMNVGRFHPVDKTLQYLLDSLPFIVLGISADVLALYFVFYAINGFFQHCNISIRLGLMNYVISGPELHRWHHSKRTSESNNNYGNNLIIWDIIFGTWFLPNNRNVETLGLINRNYPTHFCAQLKSPFIKNLDKNQMEQTS